MTAAGDLVLEIGEIIVEGVAPGDAARVRAAIEKTVADAARRLAGSAGGGARALRLGNLSFDLATAGEGLAPGAEAEIVRRLESAIAAAWEAAR